ncbi:hypothetical protein PQX77_018504 [Marasmius sp. AFHP31]|nr:hypothetical protein PQX77_018504 [Marasmius sp. AFHP31]
MPELVKALILMQAIPKVWEAATSKCLHDYMHMENVNNTASSKSGSSSGSSRSSVADPAAKELPLTLNCVQNAIIQQQQRPRPPQHQQQRGQQQQNNQQQHAPPLNQEKGKKTKQQQQGTRGGIDRDAGNSGGNCPHGHSHFASVASTITPPFSSVMKHKDRVALNAIEQSLRAEIATKPYNLGSPPPANFKGFWDESCDSTLDCPPPPPKKKNPASMQKFTGFKSSESVFEDVCESRPLADRIGVSKTAKTLKGFEGIVAAKVRCTDKLASKAHSSLQERIGTVASLSKCPLEDDDGPGYISSHSSKRAHGVDPDEDDDVEMDNGNHLTSLFSDDVDNDIAKAAGVEDDIPDNVSLGSFYDNPLVPYLDLLPNTDTTSQRCS